MRVVVQRVSSASVCVDDRLVSQIGTGLLVLVGLSVDDTVESFESFDPVIKKMIQLRIFPDDQGKMNKSVQDVQGEILLVSQFTLYADCRKGNRPSFVKAMPPDKARVMYAQFVDRVKELFGSDRVHDGEFGAYMQVSLVNDGPVTILL